MIDPKKIILLMLSVSAVFVRTASGDTQPDDQFNFESLSSRNSNQSLTPQNDLSSNEIMLVRVKDEANESDPETDLGMVVQEYSISQTEVTAQQYCNYLNQVATGENYQLFYNEKMGSDPNVASIKRDVVDGKNVYSIIKDKQGDRGNLPIVYVNLYQAARFCNWLQNRNTPGLTGDDLTERGAYTLEEKSAGRIARNPGAVWFIPTESEWYKSAYYKGGGLQAGYWNFANRSNDAPSHLLGRGWNSANYCTWSYAKQKPPYLTDVDYFKKSVGTYNTLDMSGNVAEWVATEESQGAIPLKYVARGGSWKSLYYGRGLESKCDVTHWGLELSKWSRPAYDPTQGYDNIGFRVATSLLVDSAPPSSAAPGEHQFTPPTETLVPTFLFLTGLGAIFSRKTIMKYRENAEAAKATEAQLRENQREKTAAPTIARTEEERVGDESIPLKFQEGCNNLYSTSSFNDPEKLFISQQEKEKLEALIANINPLFDKALCQYQAGKKLLKNKGPINADSLKKLETMSDTYDAYASAVTTIADQLKKQFPEKNDLWIPWHTVAIDVSIEAIILRHAAIKDYFQFGTLQSLDENLQQKIAEMRYNSNNKTLAYRTLIPTYQEAIAKIQKQEPSTQKTPLEKDKLIATASRLFMLEDIAKEIDSHERQIQSPPPVEASIVTSAYSNYAALLSKPTKSAEEKNIYALFYLNDDREHIHPANLVLAAQLKEKFHLFLQQCEVTPESNFFDTPTYETIYPESDSDLTPMSNPQGRRSIIGKIVPIQLDYQFPEK